MRYITKTNLLTVKEVSLFLKLGTLTIYKYIRERKLEAIRFGGHYRIEKQSLDKFIDRHRLGEDNRTPSIEETVKPDGK